LAVAMPDQANRQPQQIFDWQVDRDSNKLTGHFEEPERLPFLASAGKAKFSVFLEKMEMIKWCAVVGVFVAFSLTTAALAEPEQAGTNASSQVNTGQPDTIARPNTIADNPKPNAASKAIVSKSKAKLSSKTIADQRNAGPSPKAAAAKPKVNASSKVTASKSRAKSSPRVIAGHPKANPSPKLIVSMPKARPASNVVTGEPSANPAAKSSVANANAALMTRPHRIVIQVDQNDPAVMNLALNNATNVIDYYRAKQQDVQVDLVTYGPGLHMLRDDTSPVKDRIKQLKDSAFPSTVQFSACTNTKENMEKKEGKPVSIVSDAVLVPSGVVHLMELQESGWSYVRP
jgi:uncharacterized protein